MNLAFYDRAHKIRGNDNLFHKQVTRIKKVNVLDGYPRYIRNKIIKRLENRKQIRTLIHLNKKILLQVFAEYPMQEYKEKNSSKIWSENI